MVVKVIQSTVLFGLLELFIRLIGIRAIGLIGIIRVIRLIGIRVIRLIGIIRVIS